MIDGHNWNQIHQFLLNKEFKQIKEQDDGIISYQDKMERRLTIIKSNNMSGEYLERILEQLEVTYEDFKAGYEEAYAVGQ